MTSLFFSQLYHCLSFIFINQSSKGPVPVEFSDLPELVGIRDCNRSRKPSCYLIWELCKSSRSSWSKLIHGSVPFCFLEETALNVLLTMTEVFPVSIPGFLLPVYPKEQFRTAE